MAALVRKNVMVDQERLRRLARHLGMSESAAVRYAIDSLLDEEEFMAAAETIRRRGGLEDVFGRTRRE